MAEGVSNPLNNELLEAAAHLALHHATMSRLITWPPGAGSLNNRKHHDQRHRFEAARDKLTADPSLSLEEMGLTASDCKWAATQAKRASDPSEWKRKFDAAYLRLKEKEEGSWT